LLNFKSRNAKRCALKHIYPRVSTFLWKWRKLPRGGGMCLGYASYRMHRLHRGSVSACLPSGAFSESLTSLFAAAYEMPLSAQTHATPARGLRRFFRKKTGKNSRLVGVVFCVVFAIFNWWQIATGWCCTSWGGIFQLVANCYRLNYAIECVIMGMKGVVTEWVLR